MTGRGEEINCHRLAFISEMPASGSDPDPDDIALLVDIVKNCQKFPRELAQALQVVENAQPETPERIFFDCGGSSAWAAYALVKRAAKKTGHVPGRRKTQRLMTRLEHQTVEAHRLWATQLATALEPDRTRNDTRLHTLVRQPGRERHTRRSRHQKRADAAGGPEISETASPSPRTEARLSPFPGIVDLSPIQTPNLDSSEEFFSEQGHVLSGASVLECTKLFPSYLAGAVKRYPRPRNAGAIAAAVSIWLPHRGWSGCLLKIEVISSKIDYIARELFGAHLEAENGCRYIYLSEGSRVVPNPRLTLRDCRIDMISPILGSTIADAILPTEACQADLNEGRDRTGCVTMVVSQFADKEAEVYALLDLENGAMLRDKLYR